MGKKVAPRNKIMQRSIGFRFRQIEFFNENPDFKPDSYCRQIIDRQIEESGQLQFLENETTNQPREEDD